MATICCQIILGCIEVSSFEIEKIYTERYFVQIVNRIRNKFVFECERR